MASSTFREAKSKHAIELITSSSSEKLMICWLNKLGAIFVPHGRGHFLGIDTHDPGATIFIALMLWKDWKILQGLERTWFEVFTYC